MLPFYRFMAYLLAAFLPREHAQSLSGDFIEDCLEITENQGSFMGVRWCLAQVVRSAWIASVNKLIWSLSMLNNNMKLAWRQLVKHRGNAAINILGLSLGMATAVFILLWVTDELSVDRFHKLGERIYLVESVWESNGNPRVWDVTPAQLGPAMEQDLPEVERAVQVKRGWHVLVKSGRASFEELDFYCVSPSFFEVFDFPKADNAAELFRRNASMIFISRSMAEKYFGTQEAVGQVLHIAQKLDMTVAGVFEDFPANSHLHMNFIAPWSVLPALGENLDDWGRFDFRTYLLVQPGMSCQEVNQKLSGYYQTHRPQSDVRLNYVPLYRIHLYSDNGAGSILYVRLFTAVALVILLVACINFINLSTARATLRGRELGVRKVVGAGKTQLVRQFLGESFLLALLALAVALLLVVIFLPGFNVLAAKSLTLHALAQPATLAGLAALVVFSGLMAGLYPALYLASFHPLKTLRQSRGSSTGSQRVRKALVIAQFAISTALVVVTLIMNSQIRFLRSKDLGYDRENVFYVQLSRQSRRFALSLKEQFSTLPGVTNVAVSDRVPINQGNFASVYRWEGKQDDSKLIFHGQCIDEDYLELMGIELAVGRNFRTSGDAEAVIVNEEAVRQMGLKDPLGVKMAFWDCEGRIVGVVKDFHYKPLTQKITPLFMVYDPSQVNKLIFKVEGPAIASVLEEVQKGVMKLAPDYPFEYHFLDDRIEALYRNEVRSGQLLKAFTALIILTSCMGLFGLAAFTAQRRTKEIGIRKTLGASVPSISMLLAREFLLLVISANVLAWPMAYWAMQRWLNNFSYKVSINFGYFVGAAGTALLIAMATVSYQALKAALSDPVKSLRTE